MAFRSGYLGQLDQGGRQPAFYRTKRRDFVLPFLAAALVLVGCFRLVGFSDLSDPDNVSRFQLSFGFIALGYLLSLHFSKRLIWLMLIVAAVARIAVLPIEPGETLERQMWDARILAAGHNPYELAPQAEKLSVFRDGAWEWILDADQATRQLPASIWVFGFFQELGFSASGMKTLLLVVDLLLCLLFALRFGADRAVLYAWNPLAIYCVGGLGVGYSLFLLPFVAGYLIWDFWVDQKGGVSVVQAAGGIGSALGQMVCVASFLMGVGAALNLALAPCLLWVTWQVLRRSGLKAGSVALVFAAAPLLLSLMWASISLDLSLASVWPQEFAQGARSIALFPSILGFFASEWSAEALFLVIMLLAALWLTQACEKIERFMSLYLIWLMALATSVYPWTFLLMAVVGVSSGNYVFRVASLSAFAYFGAYRAIAETGEWNMPWSLQTLVWLPFALAAAVYTFGSRSRRGFYVNSF